MTKERKGGPCTFGVKDEDVQFVWSALFGPGSVTELSNRKKAPKYVRKTK